MALSNVTLFSKYLARDVNLNIITPDFTNNNQPVPVLILLHGWFGCQNDWIINSRIMQLAQTYNILVVLPNGENKFYLDVESTDEYYSSFIGIELINWIRNTFRVSEHYTDTLIAGLSMGGYGALINGLKFHETFGHIIALSPTLFMDLIIDKTTTNENFLSIQQFRRLFELSQLDTIEESYFDYEHLANIAIDSKRPPNIYLACGTEDKLYQYNTYYHSYLKDINYPITATFDQGEHNWLYWDTHIEKALEWYSNLKSTK